MRKLNLGSGPNSANGWINYDWGLMPLMGKLKITSFLVKLGILDKSYDWKWPNLELVDIRRELPDDDNSVDYIYCSHVLEHFELWEQEFILREVYRILKVGGVIRIVVPDLEKLIRKYRLGKATAFNTAFFGWYKDQGNRIKYRQFIREHKWIHDKISLRELLKKVGFKNIDDCNCQIGSVPNLNILDLKEYKNHSLYIEAIK